MATIQKTDDGAQMTEPILPTGSQSQEAHKSNDELKMMNDKNIPPSTVNSEPSSTIREPRSVTPPPTSDPVKEAMMKYIKPEGGNPEGGELKVEDGAKANSDTLKNPNPPDTPKKSFSFKKFLKWFIVGLIIFSAIGFVYAKLTNKKSVATETTSTSDKTPASTSNLPPPLPADDSSSSSSTTTPATPSPIATTSTNDLSTVFDSRLTAQNSFITYRVGVGIIEASASGPKVLLPATNLKSLSLNSDGTKAVFTTSGQTIQTTVVSSTTSAELSTWSVDLPTGTPTQLSANLTSVAISPDGLQLAAVEKAETTSYLVTTDLAGSNPKRLGEIDPQELQIVWLGNASIVYSLKTTDLTGHDLVMVDVASAQTTQLTSSQKTLELVASSDGQKLALTYLNSAKTGYVAAMLNPTSRQIAGFNKLIARVTKGVFAPNGTSFTVINESGAIYQIDTISNTIKQIPTTKGFVGVGYDSAGGLMGLTSDYKAEKVS